MVKTGAHGVGLSLEYGLAMFDSRFIDETEIAISTGDCDLRPGDCDLNQNPAIAEGKANDVGSPARRRLQ